MSRYIDADWLLNFFEPYPNDYQTPLGSLRACVDDAPSIDIEPKRGEWKWQSSMVGSFIEKRYRCSNCQYEITTQREEPIYNFCPNCGARMKGVDDD